MKKWYFVNKKALLMIAGIVWMLAGFNVARLGVLSYTLITFRVYFPLLSVAAFLLFGTMFYKMSRKHIKRIAAYEESHRPFWNFFDLKSYIIMAVMMSVGIGFRNLGIFPDVFVAFFYTGLGCALFLAGVLFAIAFFKENFLQYQNE